MDVPSLEGLQHAKKLREMQEEINDFHLNHTIWRSHYNDDFYADFLAELLVSKVMVFSVFGVWAKKTSHPSVPHGGDSQDVGHSLLNQESRRQIQMNWAPYISLHIHSW